MMHISSIVIFTPRNCTRGKVINFVVIVVVAVVVGIDTNAADLNTSVLFLCNSYRVSEEVAANGASGSDTRDYVLQSRCVHVCL